MIAPIKITGAALTNSHSNRPNALHTVQNHTFYPLLSLLQTAELSHHYNAKVFYFAE